jgi:hypothetical protein
VSESEHHPRTGMWGIIYAVDKSARSDRC